MQLIKDRNAIRTQSLSRGALMLMPGSMPASKEELMAAVNLADWQDIYAKSVGCVEAISAVASAKYANVSATTLTWLKGGTFQIPAPPATPTGVYGIMPDEIRIDVAGISTVTASRGFAHMFLHHSDITPQTHYVKYMRRDGEGELAYILKFKRSVKVTHLLYYGAGDSTYNATHFKLSVKVDGSWVEVLNWARTSTKTAVALNAPTYGTEFRIEFFGLVAGSTTGTVVKSIMLLTDEIAPSVAVPDVSWGIMVNYGFGILGITAYTEMEKPQYGSLLPCVIGSISSPLGTGDFKISKNTGLVSSDNPTLADFKYFYGNLEVL